MLPYSHKTLLPRLSPSPKPRTIPSPSLKLPTNSLPFRSKSPSPYQNMDKILDFTDTTPGCLYLGDFYAAQNREKLRETGVKTVLTMAAGLNIRCEKGVKHHVFQALDYEYYDISKHFETCCKLIDEALQKGSVLVHCAAGVSRSATVVIAYLMRKNAWSLSQALKFVKEKRSVVFPNPGFMRQLRLWEKKVKNNGKN